MRVGTFTVPAVVRNPRHPERSVALDLLVETGAGATWTLLPADIVTQLDLPTPCRRSANARPVPAAIPNSVGAVAPGPNGSCPPRTPSRKGPRPAPTSIPADQLKVLKEPGPAPDHDRQATAAASRALGLGARRTPPPIMVGRSVSAVTAPPTRARSRSSDRAHAASRRARVRSRSRLPETPKPS